MKKLLSILTLLFVSVVTTACINNFAIQDLNNKAKQYLEQGETEKAISRLLSSLDLDGSIFETHYNLAVAYFQNNQTDLAIEQFEKAKEIKSDFADLYYSLALAQEQLAYEILHGESKPSGELKSEEKESVVLKQNPENEKQKAIGLLSKSIDNYEKYLEFESSQKDSSEIKAKVLKLESELSSY